MEQELHHEEIVPTHGKAILAECEDLNNESLEYGINRERDEQSTDDLAVGAMQQVAPLGSAAPDSEEQSHTGAEADDTIASSGSANLVTDGEAETKTSSPSLEPIRQVLANVYADPERHTVALLLDDATANMVIYAVRVLVADLEAHAREARLVGATMPPDSYGAANRNAIASRHERIALRLRALDKSYRDEITTALESLRFVYRVTRR